MSGTVRAGLVFGLAAVLAFLGGFLIPIPCVNMILGFGSVIALGWGAGYTGAKTTGAGPGQGTGRGLTAGAIAGTVVLIGSVLVFLLVQYIPGFQDAISQGLQQAAQQNPEVGDVDVGSFLGLGLGIAGFMCGIINFILMLIGGAIGGMMWKGTPTTADYVPAGSYQPNQPFGNPPSTSGDEGGARIYDSNDPNRQQ
ncbi:MAG TPA: hypothetical protein VFZ66_14555 [Herpetosiphonaceae bacterium]